MPNEIDDLKDEIAKRMDVYEFLDILEFSMTDLVEVLGASILDKIEEFKEALR